MCCPRGGFCPFGETALCCFQTHGKKVLTGKELGIPSLEKGKIELSNFSDKPFALTPTQLSQKYKEVELEELLEMLMDL